MNKNRKFRGFLIDADNTIFDFDRSEEEAFYETARVFGLPYYNESIYSTYKAINENIWRKLERGEIQWKQLQVERFRIFLTSIGKKADPAEFSKEYLNNLSKKSYLIPHAADVIAFLSKRASLVLGTNGISLVQRSRLARSGMEIFFQDIIISEEIGISKPDPGFYKKAASKLHLPPYEILCVGDNPASDIFGGHRAGFPTCWYIYKPMPFSYRDFKPDYIINDLRELKNFAPDPS
ncbi:MAG: noncanonical pyrimidine nucleotidase, YjjG family [Spirochaetes bacterium]|nr:MAG: noncanonical pyrimidine nucleotidase, YjjG family [Spirochaetota bacterium]